MCLGNKFRTVQKNDNNAQKILLKKYSARDFKNVKN